MNFKEMLKDKKKKRMLIIAAAVFVALIIALIVTLVLVLDDDDDGGQTIVPSAEVGEPVTFDEVMSSAFYPKSFSGSWVSDTVIETTDPASGNLVQWDVETNDTTTVGSQLPEGWSLIGYAPNSATLALAKNASESVWRHSTLANYAVYDESSNDLQLVLPAGMAQGDGPVKLSYATWLPSNAAGENRVAFVYENDVFVKRQFDDDASVAAVTDTGLPDTLYNGKPDWVYEEEILSTDNALYASPDGRYLAFARFNDTEVEEFYYTVYGDPDDPYTYQYPTEIMLKYPKVGSSNPTVALFVQDLDSLYNSGANPVEVVPPPEVSDVAFTGTDELYIYTAAKFSKDEVLSITWANRIQNKGVVSSCAPGPSEWTCTQVSALEEANGWLDIFQPPLYDSNGEQLVQIRSHPDGADGDGLHYKHVALASADAASGQDVAFLTQGRFVVMSIKGWDETAGVIYFTGTAEDDPGTQHLYSVTTADPYELNCLTCTLAMPISAEPCSYSSVSMSTELTYYIQNCLGPAIPESVLRETATGDVVYVLEDNAELRDKLVGKALGVDRYLDVELSSNFTAKVRLRLPPGLDEATAAAAAHPLLVDVYGGPESQDVTSAWYFDSWGDYLVTNYGVAYAYIDGRGTGHHSNELLFSVYGSLGTNEIADQIEVAEALLDDHAFLDANRTGIWGWSYGGYATLRALQIDDDDVFKCGVIVAPPTNWLFYDSMYTERYMRLPTEDDNKAGYDQGSVILPENVEKLRGKTFQLNHGVADDNVHYQQSMMLIRALELEDIHFQQQSYPDENHGLGSVRTFLYRSFDGFWSQCFDYEIVE